ncbi:MAG TPA: MarR family winged helix-turn-helix transcriptional regulator [Gaiellaceae bacterium]|nr:MarR family winged helix-turn-helix transcriptional regulator [Gaiellaceae bacterium]HLM34536.1 MarR family winged helix-turn-helix transcriptional regulator [Gaiellaceae bacterium]
MSRSAAPRSDAPPQRVSLLLEIYSLQARTSALVQREFARDALPLDDYAALSAIGAFGPITLTELATMLGTPLTTMSDTARRLERRRQVARRPNPVDGRSALFELTPAGDEAWRAGWPALQRATEAIRAGLAVPEDEVRAAVRRLDAAVAAALTDT